MARTELRRPENAEGDFFVDDTCIDCDACRQIAPRTFGRRGQQSAVQQQPSAGDELLAAQRALLSCPTASIGDAAKRDVRAAMASLPLHMDGPVFFCGYTSERSFGAVSYLVQRADGNLLIDSPRFTEPLAANIEALGGVGSVLLTHKDDIADHDRFSIRFEAGRLLHHDDVTIRTRGVEWQPRGADPVEIVTGVIGIPTPGHTKGHMVFLVDDLYLFTGDHLSWDPSGERLVAFHKSCWYSWSEQMKSMRRLLDYRFEWVLPGHGRPIHLAASRMREELERCVAWMQRMDGAL